MVVDEASTLRNFIVGSSNKRAVMRLRRSWRATSRPLLLLGPSGVGKSHLLHAMANHFGPRGPRVLALRAHEFRERYVVSIQAGAIGEFRSWLRRHDVLVVDELEDLARHDSVLAELSSFVRELVTARRRVYLATERLWPALFDVLAGWDAELLPIEQPSLAQRSAAILRRGRRSLTRAKMLAIARSFSTIPEARAALERQLFASAIADVSMAPA